MYVFFFILFLQFFYVFYFSWSSTFPCVRFDYCSKCLLFALSRQWRQRRARQCLLQQLRKYGARIGLFRLICCECRCLLARFMIALKRKEMNAVESC